MCRPILCVMGSDVHISAMWVRAPDDQPAACICSACLICCSPTRRDSLIDPDIHWTHITISPHTQERKHTHARTRGVLWDIWDSNVVGVSGKNAVDLTLNHYLIVKEVEPCRKFDLTQHPLLLLFAKGPSSYVGQTLFFFIPDWAINNGS